MRRLSALLAAALFAFTTLAPAAADARDRRGRHDGYYDRHYSDRYDRRHRRDDGDAVAAGVIGLVLGLAIGAAAQERRQRREEERYYQRDDDYYPYDDGRRSAYEDDYDYDYAEPQCTRPERQWDRYANRYVTVDVPC
jgi:hypothetical protein